MTEKENSVTIREGIEGYFPLSYQQERIWIMSQKYPEKQSLWNFVFELSREATIDLAVANTSFNNLIGRHASLRTSILMRDGEPVQEVKSQLKVIIDNFHDTIKGTNVGLSLPEVIEFYHDIPFELTQSPLIKLILVKCEEDEVLLCVIHHIITDAHSNSLIVQDFNSIYNSLLISPKSEDLPIGQQYYHYAAWQRNEFSDSLSSKEKYWLKKFRIHAPSIPLSFDKEYLADRTFQGRSEYFTFDLLFSRRIREFCRNNGILIFNFFLSGYAILLQKYSDQEDIIISSPFRGRNEFKWLNDVIGLFVNVVPFRMNVDPEISLSNFFKLNQFQILESFKNQEYPFQILMDRLGGSQSQDRNPLFDVSINYMLLTDLRKKAQEGEVVDDQVLRDCLHDLNLIIRDGESHISVELEYRVDLFNSDSIHRMTEHLRNILLAIVQSPEIRIGAVSYMSSIDKTLLLDKFNDTGCNFPKHSSLIELFEKQVTIKPSSVALVHNDLQITFSELNAKADQLAGLLRKKGLACGDIVGLWLERSSQMIVGILGILKAGGVCMPIDIIQPVERACNMLKKAGARVVIIDAPRLTNQMSEIIQIELAELEIIHEKGVTRVAISSESAAYVIFTSGSTGTPNGVIITHRSIVNYVYSQGAMFGINETDRILQFSSIGFDPSIEQIWLALLHGAVLVLIDRDLLTEPAKMNQYLLNHSVTHIHATPSYLENIEFAKPNNIRRVISGGEECKKSVVTRFVPEYDFFNKYGPTETTISSIAGRVDENEIARPKVQLGKPIKNTSVYILSKRRELLPIGCIGELYISGEGVSQGYINNPKLTDEKFVDCPFRVGEKMYKTGDLGRWLGDGNIEFAGRLDHQIKIRGFRIEPGEVEHCLLQFPSIQATVVVADERGKEKYLVAYYVSEVEINSLDLRTQLKGRLPFYMVPSFYVRIESMPMTISGKVDKRALPDYDPGMSDDVVLPTTETEKQLVKIWSSILGLEKERIGVITSFFELGGHSLLAIKLAKSLFQILQIEIPLTVIFRLVTIRELSREIDSKKISKINLNEIVILLHEGQGIDNNLFLIHDGSGDVGGYIELVSRLTSYRCWGIRSKTLSRLGPVNLDIEELARVYIDEIMRIQPSGPYKLGGWSLGGLVAFEMASQLEARGEKVDHIIMIDTRFSHKNAAKNDGHYLSFPLAREIDFVSELTGTLKEAWSEASDLEDLWSKVLTYLGNVEHVGDRPHNIIPEEFESIIPNFESMDVKSRVIFMNTMRSLRSMSSEYIPKKKLNTKLFYFKSSQSPSPEELFNLFDDTIVTHEIAGDHFSILRSPGVNDLAIVMNNLVK